MIWTDKAISIAIIMAMSTLILFIGIGVGGEMVRLKTRVELIGTGVSHFGTCASASGGTAPAQYCAVDQ